jgi:hypothetical protein
MAKFAINNIIPRIVVEREGPHREDIVTVMCDAHLAERHLHRIGDWNHEWFEITEDEVEMEAAIIRRSLVEQGEPEDVEVYVSWHSGDWRVHSVADVEPDKEAPHVSRGPGTS